MSFDWRTEEDNGWQDEKGVGKTAVSPSKTRARWWLGLMVLLGIVAVWGLVQWQVKQRVTAATGSVESELVATQNFILQTAVSQDEQLFRTTLSGRDLGWSEVQKTLLTDGLLLDRPMLGWQHVPQPALTNADVTVQLSPDLRAAELSYPQTYVVQGTDSVTETVTLQQTAVYRQGNTRWLYAPPYDEFWGDWVTNSGKNLTLVYPDRDAEFAEQLAADLDALVGQMCIELDDLNCTNDLQVHLRLDNDPDILLTVDEVETMLSGSLRLNLPSPTLVGTPADEAGYQALFRAYGVQVATAVLAHQVDYDCCRHQLFFRALRDYQLADLGLQAWPINEAAYNSILTSILTHGFDGNASRHWTRRWTEAPPLALQVYQVEDSEPIWQQVYLLVEYLMTQETAVSPTEMMRLMDKSSFADWFTVSLSRNYDQNLLATEVLEYIYAQSTANQQAEPPLPLPSGKITAVCGNGFPNSNSKIYQYSLMTSEWRQLDYSLADSSNVDYYNINSADGRRFLITSNNFSNNESTIRVILLTPDGETLLEDSQFASGLEQPPSWVTYYFVGSSGDFFVRNAVTDGVSQTTMRQTDCPTAACPEKQLPGWPNFSPDNNHFLAYDYGTFFASDVEEERHQRLMADLSLMTLEPDTDTVVGQGGWASWLNESTYAYWRWEDETVELVTAVISQNTPRVLLNEADLLAIIPLEQRPEALFPSFLGTNPQNPQELLLPIASSPLFDSNEPHFLFKLTLTADFASVDTIELLDVDSSGRGFGYSPNGRYITLVDHNFSGADATWTFWDQTTDELSEPISTEAWNMPWSPDGQWFIQSQKNYLLLHAPVYNYQHLIPHGLGTCQQVLWTVDE